MRKNVISFFSVLTLTTLVQAGGFEVLKNYHSLEAIRTGDLNHLNQALMFSNLDKMEKQRKQREEEARKAEAQRAQEHLEEIKRAELQRQQAAQSAAQTVQPVTQQPMQPAKHSNEVATGARAPVYGPVGSQQVPPRKFVDPVIQAKKNGGTFFWDEGVCKQKLPNGDIDVHSGEAIVIRLCRGSGAPADINLAYEKYLERRQPLLNKKFAFIDEEALKGARSCKLLVSKNSRLVLDVMCKERIALRLPLKSDKTDKKEFQDAFKAITEKMQYHHLFTEDSVFSIDREVYFNSVD